MTQISDLFSVIVPAAGVGARMQAHCPKQYLPLADSTLLEHTLSQLLAHPRIGQVYLALHVNDPYFPELKISQDPRITAVPGGKERADSVLAALNAMPVDTPWVLVHDGARPCILHEDIDKLLALAGGETGGILASKVRDTMKRSHENMTISCTEPRENLWHALTPQFFPFQSLKASLTEALASGVPITDEASAMEWSGHQVQLIEGHDNNIKVTRPQDLALAEFYLHNTGSHNR